MKKQLFISILVFITLATLTFLIVLYGRGYRFGLNTGTPQLSKTGILAATSIPEGAQVFVNGHLTTATDNTINLTPGEYDVKITKDGYFPWQKKLIIKEEVVTTAAALLFPTAPKLESITTLGIQNPVLDPSGTRIAYTVASQSARKNGVYVFDMTTNTVLSLQGATRQLVDDTVASFSESSLIWSPDGKELLASIAGELQTPTTYLLPANTFNESPQDVTAVLNNLEQEWANEKNEKDAARISSLKPILREQIKKYFTILSWSPDDNKILYQATTSGELPFVIKPRRIGINITNEERQLEKDAVYIYDVREDVNYKILDTLTVTCTTFFQSCNLPISWLPDSNHIIHVNDKKLTILETDNTNHTTIYAGPFINDYVFPWTNGSKVVILTNFNNPDIFPNLYTISLK